MAYIFWHSILAFFLTFYLIILTFFSGILSDILSGISSADSLFWDSAWHLFWHSVLPFYLTFSLAYTLTSYLTFFLAYVSGIPYEIISGILFGMSSEILCGSGPAGNTLIRSSRLRSGGEHCDQLAVERRRRAGWHKIYQPSPDRWGKRISCQDLNSAEFHKDTRACQFWKCQFDRGTGKGKTFQHGSV